jgi:hypothetical protein
MEIWYCITKTGTIHPSQFNEVTARDAAERMPNTLIYFFKEEE